MHIFDIDNFLIITKSIFFDIDNLPITWKNADISAINDFFDNIAHPYFLVPAVVMLLEHFKDALLHGQPHHQLHLLAWRPEDGLYQFSAVFRREED